MTNPGCPPPYWFKGPAPGAFFPFSDKNQSPSRFRQVVESVTELKNNLLSCRYTQNVATTTTSIVAIQYNAGVMMAGDTLGSYGSLARFKNCSRIIKVNDKIILGAGGDYGDFQHLKAIIEGKVNKDDCIDDGTQLKPKELHCWLTRILYNRRCQLDPLWVDFVIAGNQDGQPFLGFVEKKGVAFKDKIICTGYGAHLISPLLRDALLRNPKLNKEDAKSLIEKSMEILYYRDARSYLKYQIGSFDLKDGINIEGPLTVRENWNIARLIN